MLFLSKKKEVLIIYLHLLERIDKKALTSSKKTVKQLDKSKSKSKQAMVNLTKKIAMVKDSKSKTKKNKMNTTSIKQVKNKKTSNTHTIFKRI